MHSKYVRLSGLEYLSGTETHSKKKHKDGSRNRGLSAQESWGKNYTREEHVLRMVYELYTLEIFRNGILELYLCPALLVEEPSM